MKTKNISYNEAKQLLLQGVEIKLPEWEGYWKFNAENKTIEAHLKNGNVAQAMAEYTLHDNWEIATIENCPILKEEIETRALIQEGEIKHIKPTLDNGVPNLMIYIESGDKIVVVNTDTLFKLFGRKETDKMITNYLFETTPKEKREAFQDFMDDVDSMFKDLRNIVEKHMN